MKGILCHKKLGAISAIIYFFLLAVFLQPPLAVGQDDGLEERDRGNQKRVVTINRMINRFESKFDVQIVTANHAKQYLEDPNYIFVDVRTDDEMATSKIAGAITVEQFHQRKGQFKQQGRKVIAYCTIGYRSSKFVSSIEDEFDAYNLRGSILLWTHAGGELVDQKGESTKVVHVYGRKWDLLPIGYRGVY